LPQRDNRGDIAALRDAHLPRIQVRVAARSVGP